MIPIVEITPYVGAKAGELDERARPALVTNADGLPSSTLQRINRGSWEMGAEEGSRMDSWASTSMHSHHLVCRKFGPKITTAPNAVRASESSYGVINQDVIYGREVD